MEMTYKTDGNDKVHPINEAWSEPSTKREYFAAMAMQGLLANPTIGNSPVTNDELSELGLIDSSEYDCRFHWPVLMAKQAIRQADALIAELNKEQGARGMSEAIGKNLANMSDSELMTEMEYFNLDSYEQLVRDEVRSRLYGKDTRIKELESLCKDAYYEGANDAYAGLKGGRDVVSLPDWRVSNTCGQLDKEQTT